MDKNLLEKMNDNKKTEKESICIEMGQFSLPWYERNEKKEKDKKKEVILAVTEKCTAGKDQRQKNVEQGEPLDGKEIAVILHAIDRRENRRSAAERLERNANSILVLFGFILVILVLVCLKMVADKYK